MDPFDLDVFTPHMQKHVTRQKSRNLVRISLSYPLKKELDGRKTPPFSLNFVANTMKLEKKFLNVFITIILVWKRKSSAQHEK